MSRPLVERLSALTAELARTSSREALLSGATEGLLELGLFLFTAQFLPTGVRVHGIAASPAVLELEKTLGRPLVGLSGPLLPNGPAEKILCGGDAIFVEDFGGRGREFLLRSIPGLSRAQAEGFVRGMSKAVFAPLFLRGSLWGLMGVASDSLAAEDTSAIALFAAHLGAALETTDFVTSLRRKNRDLEAVHTIATEPSQGGKVRSLAVMAHASDSDAAVLWDAHRGILSVFRDGEGLLDASPAHVVAEGRTCRTFRAPQSSFHDQAEVSLLEDGQCVAHARFGRRRGPSYTDEDITSLELLGAQLGMQLERERLREEVEKRLLREERRANDFSHINALGALVAREQELASVYAFAVKELRELTSAPNVFLLLREGDLLVSVATSLSADPSLSSFEMKLSEPSVAREAIQSKEPVCASPGDPRIHRGLASRFHHETILAIPLLSLDDAIGVIVLGHTETNRSFSTEEVERAVTIAHHVCAGVERARTYSKLKESLVALELAQQELVRHERLAAVGELAAVMAHEVRNPLAVIYNSLGQLERAFGARTNHETKLLFSMLREEAEHINRIVGDLLLFARPYSVSPRLVSSGDLLCHAISTTRGVAPSVATEFVLDRGRGDFPLWADSELTRQALLNIVLNAVQAMPHGGRVTLCARPAGPGDPYDTIEIADEGVGLPLGAEDKIFDPFFTTKAKGTGLGLSVVRRIMEAHRGEVRARRRAEGGTVFELRLPPHEGRAPHAGSLDAK